jgi:hypothetical protein
MSSIRARVPGAEARAACQVDLVYLVHLVCFVQPKDQIPTGVFSNTSITTEASTTITDRLAPL